MLIGYARVSKADGSQSLDLQRDALRADGVDAGHVYHDVASGAGARVMTDSPTRVAQRWYHWVPGAAVALMAAAATLLPGLAVLSNPEMSLKRIDEPDMSGSRVNRPE